MHPCLSRAQQKGGPWGASPNAKALAGVELASKTDGLLRLRRDPGPWSLDANSPHSGAWDLKLLIFWPLWPSSMLFGVDNILVRVFGRSVDIKIQFGTQPYHFRAVPQGH